MRARCSSIGCQDAVDSVLAEVPLCAGHKSELAMMLGATASSVVYYATWGSLDKIKIGTSTKPLARFREHAKRSGKAVFPLAAHPGARSEERSQHRRFAHLLLPGECEVFWRTDELDEHMETVRDAWPQWEELIQRVGYARRAHPRRKSA